MKRIILTVILTFFLTLTSTLTYAAVIGKLTAIQGDVDVLKPGMERAAPAVLQQPLSEGDIIRTKSNGKAEITFVDDSVVRLAPNSRLQITEYLMEGNKRKSGVMNLFRGKMRAVVSKSRGFLAAAFGESEKFEVRTPTAVAGVRGTDFFISYQMGVTAIAVREGRVDTFNPAIPGQIVRVAEGMATTIAGNAPPSQPRPASDVEMIRYMRDTDTSEKPKEDEDTTLTTVAAVEGDVFGYEAPEGTEPPPTDGTATEPTDLLPSSETHTELLKDIQPPVITTSGPPPYTKLSTAVFAITFNEPVTATYTMGSWGAISTATTSDSFSIDTLPGVEATWMLTVTATDAAGNISTTSYSWTTDYTAPAAIITPVSASPLAGTDSTVNINLSSNESSTYSYSLDKGATWVSTGSSLNLSGVPEGANTIQITATDAAGNTSSPPSLSFDLSRYSLSGTAVLTSSGVQDIGTAAGEIAGVSNQNWGGYNITLSGNWWKGGSSTYTLIAGGTSTDTLASNNGGYWIETISNAVDSGGTFSGTSNLKYLSFDRLGKGTGAVNGSYSSAWSTTYSGTYTETPLAWSGKIVPDGNSASLYSTSGIPDNWLNIEGNNGGLMGGTVSPWSGASNVTYMGQYSITSATPYGPPYLYLWTPEINSYNPTNLTNTTFDGGAYKGFIGGVWKSDGTIDAKVYSLYIDPNGNAGILKGSLTGAYYPQLNMFEADGTWTPIPLAIGLSAAGLYDSTVISSSNLTYGGTFGYFSTGGSISPANTNNLSFNAYTYQISGQNWGVWERILGGGYCYPNCVSQTTPPDTWSYEHSETLATGIKYLATEGTQWSNGKLSGINLGYGADITTTPMTWISVGETIGTFDPFKSTWQAVQTGAWLETTKFLTMAGKIGLTPDTAALAALSIPFAEVGKANLSGSNGELSVTMNNVLFFASKFTEAPKIWATNDVQGTYLSNPTQGTSITLNSTTSDFTVSVTNPATFNVQQWNPGTGSGGTWTATINGAGTLNNPTNDPNYYNGQVTMTGAAAGTNSGTPGTDCTAGSNCNFSGTGAGVAQ